MLESDIGMQKECLNNINIDSVMDDLKVRKINTTQDIQK